MKPSIKQIQASMARLADDIQGSGLYGYARRLRALRTNLDRAEPKPKSRKRATKDTGEAWGPGSGNW